MSKIRNKIDEFCYSHPNFGIPNLMKVIVIGNVVVYALYLLTNYNHSSIDFLSFNLSSLLSGEIWRIVTFIFVPYDYNPIWFAIGLFFFYSIGNALEREWGTAKFNVFFFGGSLLTLLYVIIVSAVSGLSITLAGTYYVNMSMFFAFAMLYPEANVLLIIIPIKIKYLAWISAAMFALEFIRGLFAGGGLASFIPVIALLNFFIFFWDDLSGWVREKTGMQSHHHSRKTIEFKKAVKQQKEHKGYNHKCAVCGRTDTDYPNLQFRYCSKCDGYYCYCEDHINNHVHVKNDSGKP
ncbi:MAG: rhomboid family intramembrane serine protease [Oscillospiraceae bacterium]|nr:rhomboid family intramembrane serine protease [Oscillospiraceae bacterium]